MSISRMMTNASTGIVALLALASFTAHATTAPTIVQNRDEPGRNPYQASTKCIPFAGQPKSCLARFSPLAKTDVAVIQYINCIFQTTGYGGLTATLSTKMSPTDYILFEPAARTGTTGAAATVQYILDQPILFYAAPGEQATLTVTISDSFTGDQHCFASGYRVVTP